jgi:hypothetical protein
MHPDSTILFSLCQDSWNGALVAKKSIKVIDLTVCGIIMRLIMKNQAPRWGGQATRGLLAGILVSALLLAGGNQLQAQAAPGDQLQAPATPGVHVPVFNSGTAFEDMNLYSDTQLGAPAGTFLNIGESGVDQNNCRVYIPFSISAANAALIKSASHVVLYVYLSSNSYMEGFTADLYAYPSRNTDKLLAQNGDYSGGTLLAASVMTEGTTAGWVAMDVTPFAASETKAGHTALVFKLQVHEAGLPVADQKQNNFALKSADDGPETAPYLAIVP